MPRHGGKTDGKRNNQSEPLDGGFFFLLRRIRGGTSGTFAPIGGNRFLMYKSFWQRFQMYCERDIPSPAAA